MLSPRATWIIRLAGLLKALGPYAAIELILPGGTLIAIAVWAIRRRWASAARAPARGDLTRSAPPLQTDANAL
jgi:hypothetical protein